MLLIASSSVFASWQKIASLGTPVGCCFFFNDYYGFAGSGTYSQNNPLVIWKTTNGGRTWSQMATPQGTGEVTQISIRPDGVGYASIFSQQNPDMNLWKTTDSGMTWIDVSSGRHYGTGVGISQTQFATAAWSTSPVSGTNGVFFLDPNTYIITPGAGSGSEQWSAYGDPQTRYWYSVAEQSDIVLISTDGGSKWSTAADISALVGGRNQNPTGHIAGYKGTMYFQSVNAGMFRSRGTNGAVWVSASPALGTSPSNFIDTRTIYVGGCIGEMVITFDKNGNVWKTTDGGDGTMANSAAVAFTHPVYPQISSCKTISRDFQMTNEHCYDFLITSIKFDINPGQFSIVAPTLPDTLHSSETQKFNILFDPARKPGPYSARVRVSGYFLDGQAPVQIDSIFDVNTFAFAEGPQLAATPDIINFDTASSCGGGSDTVFTLKNTGCDTLTITSGPGRSLGDFTFDTIALPYRLPPDSTIVIHSHFKPSSAGVTTVNPIFKATQQGQNASVTLTLTGIAQDGRAILSVTPVSIPFDTTTICDESQIKRFLIKNTGCVPLVFDSNTIVHDINFNTSTTTKSVVIAAGDSVFFDASFIPNTKGAHFDTITIWTRSGSFDSTILKSQIVLSGYVKSGSAQPQASLSNVNFGAMTACESRDTIFKIMNIGCDTLFLTSGTLTGAGFTMTGVSFPDTILPKTRITIPIHAAADNSAATNFSGSFTYTSDSAGILKTYPPVTFSFTVQNHPVKANFWLSIDNPAESVSSKTTIRLKADPSVISQFGSVDVTINKNQDLLASSGARGATSNTISPTGPVSYHIAGAPMLSAGADSSIALFDVVVFLTKDTATAIDVSADKIDNVVPATGPCDVQATTKGTSFTYLPGCGDIEIQKYMRGDEIRITSIEPNPTGGEIVVLIHSPQASDAESSVVSMHGNIELATKTHLNAGSNVLYLSLGSLANGTYIFVMRSNGVTVNKLITIQK